MALTRDSPVFPGAFFTTPHFDGYPAVLIDLEQIGIAELEEVLTEAWAVQAPKRLSRAYFAVDRNGRRDTAVHEHPTT